MAEDTHHTQQAQSSRRKQTGAFPTETQPSEEPPSLWVAFLDLEDWPAEAWDAFFADLAEPLPELAVVLSTPAADELAGQESAWPLVRLEDGERLDSGRVHLLRPAQALYYAPATGRFAAPPRRRARQRYRLLDELRDAFRTHTLAILPGDDSSSVQALQTAAAGGRVAQWFPEVPVGGLPAVVQLTPRLVAPYLRYCIHQHRQQADPAYVTPPAEGFAAESFLLLEKQTAGRASVPAGAAKEQPAADALMPLMDTLGLAAFRMDGDTHLLAINQRGRELSKRLAGEVTPLYERVNQRMISEDIAERFQASVRQAATTGTAITTSRAFLVGANRRIWLESQYIPLGEEAPHEVLLCIRETTERRLLEEQLERELDLQRAIFELTDIGILVVTLEGEILQVNDALLTNLNYPRRQVAGRNFTDFFLEAEREPSKLAFAAAAEGEHKLPKTVDVLAADGSLMRFGLSMRFFRQPPGETYAVATLTNITEAERNRLLLEQTEKLMNIGGWMLQLPHNVLEITEETRGIFRWPASRPFSFRRFLALQPRERRHQIQIGMAEMLQHGRDIDVELHLRTYTGETILVRATAHVQRKGEEVLRFAGTLQRLDRSTHERELERLAVLSNRLPAAITFSGTGGRVQWATPGFERVTGYSLADVQGVQPGYVLPGPRTDVQTLQRIRHAFQRGEPADEEILIYHKRGYPYWADMMVRPYYDDNRNLRGFLGMHVDATHRKLGERIMRAGFRAVLMREDVRTIALPGAPDLAVALVETSTGKLRMNAAYCQLFGVTAPVPTQLEAADLDGTRCQAHLHTAAGTPIAPAGHPLLRTLSQDTDQPPQTLRVERLDGSGHEYAATTAFPVHDETGRQRGAVFVALLLGPGKPPARHAGE